MAEYIIQDSTLTDIADAIRAKDGSSAPILTEDMADAIAAIPSGTTITDGIVFKAFAANGEPAEIDFYGTPKRRALQYCWYVITAPVIVHFVDKPKNIGYYALSNAYIHPDISTFSDVETADEGAFTFYTNAANNLNSEILSLPSFTGGGTGGSRFRVANAYYYGGFFLPKMQSIHDFDWYQHRVANVNLQIGSIGYPVTSCAQRPFGTSTGSGTITVYTTGALLDTIKTAIQNQAGANYTWVYKAAEATEYGGVSYAAGDTMLTVGGA